MADPEKKKAKKRSREDDGSSDSKKTKKAKKTMTAADDDVITTTPPVEKTTKVSKKKKAKETTASTMDDAADADASRESVSKKSKKKSMTAVASADDDEMTLSSVNEKTSEKPKKTKSKSSESKKSVSKKNKKSAKSASEHGVQQAQTIGTLFTTASTALDSALSSLFASSSGASINDALLSRAHAKAAENRSAARKARAEADENPIAVASDDEDLSEVSNDAELSPLASDDEIMAESYDEPAEDVVMADEQAEAVIDGGSKKRRRKQAGTDADDEDLEVRHLKKLAASAEKQLDKDGARAVTADDAGSEEDNASDASEEEDDNQGYVPPQHESLAPQADSAFDQASRTVFLGNVSTSAIKSKSDRKTLEAHLKSFFAKMPKAGDSAAPSALESLRFRSTPFASAIPKRAAFARKEIMDTTAHSTNAYAVYSTSALALQAVKHLNATVILGRHLRVDSIAHPSPQDSKRCVFVGNLGFVDDESAMDAADPHQTRKTKKTPSDVEEGLWQTFGTVGTVESVRVIRDAATRVGKGFAYVQFSDENGVEAALAQLNDKKFPPMLPRKLRITRARAMKRNAANKSREARGRPSASVVRGPGSGYKVKLTPQQQSQMGRAAKLLGKSAAGQMKFGRKEGRSGAGPQARGTDLAAGIKKPEDFVFEGTRAKSGTKTGIKMKKGPGKKAKPTKNSDRRAKAWKSKTKAGA